MIPISKIQYEDVLSFWFLEKNKPKWFIKDKSFDEEISKKFLHLYEKSSSHDINHSAKSADEILALIIILDQFPRNMFRNSAKSFKTDSKALSLTKYAIESNMDDADFSNDHKQFLYMPLMHSEDIADQKLCFELFAYNTQIQNYAKMHLDIIEQFGRFPHRNKILGRKSTDAEMIFLTTPNSAF